PYSTGIVAQWSDVLMCHGGFESEWLQRHKIKSIQDLNRRYQNALGTNSLDMFLEPDSPLLSRKMAYYPEAWRREDRDIVREILCPEVLHPISCPGHTTVADIRAHVSSTLPQCTNASQASLTSSLAYDARS